MRPRKKLVCLAIKKNKKQRDLCFFFFPAFPTRPVAVDGAIGYPLCCASYQDKLQRQRAFPYGNVSRRKKRPMRVLGWAVDRLSSPRLRLAGG